MGICVLWVSSAFSTALAGKPSAKELMQASEDRHRIAAVHESASMVLQSKSGEERTLDYEMWAVQDDKTGDKLRIEFANPGDVRGTALLTVEEPKSKSDDQWLYLPAFRKTRRIGNADLGDRFVGSDIYFEDMKRRYVADYEFKLIGSEEVDGEDCYVIESKPVNSKVVKESPYGKSQLWLRKDILFVVKQRHFDTKLRPLKEVRVSRLEKIAGKAWRANRAEIVDIKREHRTVVVIKSRERDPLLPEGSFSKHRLETK